MVVGKPIIIETEKPEKRNVEVTNMSAAIDGFHAKFVCRSDHVPGITSSTGNPDCHRVQIVAAPVSRSTSHTVVGRSSKFAIPDNKRAFEQTSLFQVGNQSRDGLNYATNQNAMSALDVVVTIPRAIVKLHKAHALLDKLSGKQAFSTKRIGRLVSYAVEFSGLGIFLSKRNATAILRADCYSSSKHLDHSENREASRSI